MYQEIEFYLEGEHYKILVPPTKLFVPHFKRFWNYRLGRTNYWYNAYRNVWFYDPEFKNKECSYSPIINFEGVLDNITEELQEEILFHLDFFMR